MYWQTPDRKTLKRIDTLAEEILRDDLLDENGKPEPLKHTVTGVWSSRIDEANRLVYIADDYYVTFVQVR